MALSRPPRAVELPVLTDAWSAAYSRIMCDRFAKRGAERGSSKSRKNGDKQSRVVTKISRTG